MTRSEIIDRVFPRIGLFVLLIAGSFLAGGAWHALANVPGAAAFCLYLMIPVFRELRAAGELRWFVAACVRIVAWGVPILCAVIFCIAILVQLGDSFRDQPPIDDIDSSEEWPPASPVEQQSPSRLSVSDLQ